MGKLTVEQELLLTKLNDDIERLDEAFAILKLAKNEVPKDVQARMKHTKIINILYKIVEVV